METSLKLITLILEQCEPGKVTLEPSAGYGTLSERLVTDWNCTVDVVELNKDRANVLRSQELYRSVYISDFLNLNLDRRYDQIAAVPPYKDNVDCQHIMKMFRLLNPGGKLISLTLPLWVTGVYSNQIEFRRWLSDKDYSIKLIEDTSYVSCPKMLLIVRK